MSRRADIEAAAADWVARKDGGSWSDDQSRTLETWLAAEVAHKVAYLRLATAWERTDRLSALNAPDHGSRRTGWRRAALPFAMGIAVLILSGIFVLSRNLPPSENTYATLVGQRQSVELADGSLVVLNTDTRLRAKVNGTSRIIQIDRGEAYFDVRHDPAHPFVVIAGARRITDLGTRFSVRRDGDTVRVAVEAGRVQIEPITPVPHASAASRPIEVARNAVAVADQHETLVIRQDDRRIANGLSWREGVLIFDQTTLEDAVAEFNRYNAQQLVVDNDAAARMRIDGAFRSDNPNGFVRLLHVGFGLTVRESEGRIHISG